MSKEVASLDYFILEGLMERVGVEQVRVMIEEIVADPSPIEASESLEASAVH